MHTTLESFATNNLLLKRVKKLFHPLNSGNQSMDSLYTSMEITQWTGQKSRFIGPTHSYKVRDSSDKQCEFLLFMFYNWNLYTWFIEFVYIFLE